MIFTIIENFVFFSVIFALAAYAAALAVRYGVQNGNVRISPFVLTRLYSALILFPPIAALWLVLAALLPAEWLGADVFKAGHHAPVHQWHLLTDLTAKFEPFLSYATVLFVLSIFGFIIWKSFRAYFRIGSIIQFLEIEASVPPSEKIAVIEKIAAAHRLEVGLVMSEQPLTFIWGFWQSKLVLSSGFLNALDAAEIAGVIEHEAAHHNRCDNLIKFFLSAACYFSLVFPLTQKILRWQSEQVELVCDEIAARTTKEPLEIASALVKIRRLFPTLADNPVLTSGFVSDETGSIEPRVKRLLLLADALPALIEEKAQLAAKPFFEALSFVAIFIVSLLAVVLLAPFIIHETTETLIELIK